MLKSLEIKNFRMLEDFQVPKLGRMNLIVGKNNSGKSSVLEALRIYAGNGHVSVLQKLALNHNEPAIATESPTSIEPEGPTPFEAFFTGRRVKRGHEIMIGPAELARNALTMSFGYLVRGGPEDGDLRFEEFADEYAVIDTECLHVAKGDHVLYNIRLDRRTVQPRHRSWGLPCSVIPTQFLSVDELADDWDKIALTDDQSVLTQTLRITTPEFEGLTFVRDQDAAGLLRTARVKLSSSSRLVPLNSLGDGAVRVLQLALKLVPAKGGLLLIDEFENGLHFSVQEQIWALLFRMAAKLDIQVFATTHSWDCIESFARAAHANKDVEGVLFRVGQSVRTSDKGRTIATVFDEEQLYSITQADVEVR